MTDDFEDWAVRWIIRVLAAIVVFWVSYWVSTVIPSGLMLLLPFLIVSIRYRIVDDGPEVDWDSELRDLTETGRL